MEQEIVDGNWPMVSGRKFRGRRGEAYPKSINITRMRGLSLKARYGNAWEFIFKSAAKLEIVLGIPSPACKRMSLDKSVSFEIS